MSAEDVIDRFAYKEYGQVINVDPPIYDEYRKNYRSNVKANYPIFIYDDREPGSYKVRVLKIQNIGQICLNEELKIVPEFTTYRHDSENNLSMILELWKNQAENIVITTSSDNFVRIEAFQNHFSQIDLILSHLFEYEKIYDHEIKKYLPIKDRKRLFRYINLLQSLDLIRKVHDYYEFGNEFNSWTLDENNQKSEEDLKLTVISYLIKNRYSTLRDEFKLTILEKTINIDNVIYLPELEYQNAIHRKRASIAASFKRYYNKNINPLHLTQILRRLSKCGAIVEKNQKYYGDESLRENMLSLKKRLQPLSLTPWIQ